MESYNSILRYFFPLLFFLLYDGCDTYRWLTNSYEPKEAVEVVKIDCSEIKNYSYNGFYIPLEKGKLFVKKDAYNLDSVYVSEKPFIGMSYFKSVSKTFDTQANPSVQITFTENGKLLFKEYTASNIGTKIAVIVNDKLLMFPVISSEIPNGQVEISGNFTQEEVDTLYRYINRMITCIQPTE